MSLNTQNILDQKVENSLTAFDSFQFQNKSLALDATDDFLSDLDMFNKDT